MKHSVLTVGQPLFQKGADNFSDFVKRDLGRETKASGKQEGLFESVELPKEIRRQRALRTWQDELNRGEQLVNVANKIGEVTDDINFRQKAELFPGRASEHIKRDIEDPIYSRRNPNNFLARLAKAKHTINELGEYMYAEHAPFANETLLRDKGVHNGSGLTEKEALQKLDNYKDTDINKYAKEFREKIIDKNLELLVESGLISRETAEEFKMKFKLYVPLKGLPGDIEDSFLNYSGTGQGFSTPTTGIKERKGRRSVVSHNPVVQAIDDFQKTIIRAEKNKIGQSLYKFVKQYPNDKIYEIIKNHPGALKDNDLAVFIEGKRKIIRIKDKALFEGLKNVGSGRVWNWLNVFNKFYRGSITQYSAEFMPRNFFRDIQLGLTSVYGDYGAATALKMLKDTPAAIRAVYRDQRGKTPIKYTNALKKYSEGGAKTGWMDVETLEQKTKRFETEYQKSIKRGNTEKAVLVLGDFISDVNHGVEIGIRLAAYENLKGNLSEEKALSYAKNITVNHNKKGKYGVITNALFMFSGASIKGTKRAYDILTKSRNKYKIWAGLIAAGITQNIINNLIDEEEYNRIPDWIRDTNWIFMIGNGKHIKIPLSYGLNVLPTTANLTYDMLSGRIDPSEAMGRIAQSFQAAFNPLGGENLLQTMSPTFLDLPVQIGTNKNWANQPIKPEYTFDKRPQHMQYYESVTDASKALTTKIYDLSGNLIDVSPEYIDHTVSTAFGGVGTTFKKLYKSAESIVDGKFPAAHDVPFLRSFYGTKNEYYSRTRVYELLEKSEGDLLERDKIQEFYKMRREALSKKLITAKQSRSLQTRFNNNQKSLRRSTK